MARAGRKLFYKIGEVCKICDLEPHVLRYWESEFPVLSPSKNRSGQRIYRSQDLELINTISHLLYEEGFTIAGARKVLKDRSGMKRRTTPISEQSALPFGPKLVTDSAVLSSIKQELNNILTLLAKS